MRGAPATLWIGLGLIAMCQALLLNDVQQRGGAVIGREISIADLPEPVGAVGHVARWVAINMTGLCWAAYLLVLDGLLTALARRRNNPALSSLRARPNRFIVAWLTSIPAWCFFDSMNFYLMDAWRYHGLPPDFGQRLIGYFIAFAAISPGMFLAAHLYQNLGLRRIVTVHPLHARRIAWVLLLGPTCLISLIVLLLVANHDGHLSNPIAVVGCGLLLLGPPAAGVARKQSLPAVSFATGVGFVIWTFLVADPLSNLTLWVGLVFLLDPINAKLGAPSLLRDWQAGRWGRTLALFAGGATCGLLWEFWNYWAIAKWTYDLPFLGWLNQYRYFEMPWPGFVGFLPFAAECWVMLNTIIAALDRLSLRVAESLPDPDSIL